MGVELGMRLPKKSRDRIRTLHAWCLMCEWCITCLLYVWLCACMLDNSIREIKTLVV